MLSQLALLSEDDHESLDDLEETVGVVQHHDAVTGTEKQHVADNYHLRMDRAARRAAGDLNLTLVTAPADYSSADLIICPLLNMSQCEATSNIDSSLRVNIYNQLSRERSYYVRLPVSPAPGYQVLSQDYISTTSLHTCPGH